MPFSFLHCADLHLGCAQFNSVQRYADFFDAFSAVAELAIDRRVQAVLIAGDLFHHRSIDAETLLRASRILQTIKDAGIAVVSVEGNHDKAYYLERQSWQEYLCAQGLIALLRPDGEPDWALRGYDGSSGAVLELSDCRVVGLGYLGGSTRQRLQELAAVLEPSEKPTVALLHAAIDRLMGQDMAGVSREALSPYAGKVDYFALGHIHARCETDGWAYNPGAPECVHIDEGRRGEKGCYLVSIEKSNGEVAKQVEFVPLPRRAVLYARLDTTEYSAQTASAQCLQAIRKIFSLGEAKGAMLSVSLIGHPAFSVASVDVRALETAVAEELGCLYVEIANETNDASRGESGGTFDRNALERAVFLDLAQELGSLDPQTVANIASALKNGLLGGESPQAMLDYLRREATVCESNP